MLRAPALLATTLSLAALTACESTLPQDLETFCAVVTEVDKTDGLTAEDKLRRIDARKSEYAHYALLETRDVWAEAATHKGEDKYRYLLAAAKNYKATQWKCPQYKTLLNIAAVEELGSPPPVKASADVAPASGGATAAAAAAGAAAAGTAVAKDADASASAEPAPAKAKKGHKATKRKGRRSRS